YWVQGNSSGALELLDECIARHYLHSHPALRGLGLQATVDLSICQFDSGQKDQAIALLTRAIGEHVEDLMENVNEELCRAVRERYRFLCTGKE
ncbi:MAG: hypothetical protein WBD20_14550, partial [Pirellulaceae bacterium]